MNPSTTPRKYYLPILGCTGAAQDQPTVQSTEAGWYFDKNYFYQYAGFIDAPTFIPRGGVHALDLETSTLGIANVMREGVLA